MNNSGIRCQFGTWRQNLDSRRKMTYQSGNIVNVNKKRNPMAGGGWVLMFLFFAACLSGSLARGW